MVKIRLTGAPEEVDNVTDLISMVLNVEYMSKDYPSRYSKVDKRVYIDATGKNLNQCVKDTIIQLSKVEDKTDYILTLYNNQEEKCISRISAGHAEGAVLTNVYACTEIFKREAIKTIKDYADGESVEAIVNEVFCVYQKNNIQ